MHQHIDTQTKTKNLHFNCCRCCDRTLLYLPYIYIYTYWESQTVMCDIWNVFKSETYRTFVFNESKISGDV